MIFTEQFPGEEVRALSWKQPFASLMLHGKVETRTWDTNYKGWVLICASKMPYNVRQIEEIAGKEQYNHIEKVMLANYSVFPVGQAIAIGKLDRTQPMGKYKTEWGREQLENTTFVRYQPYLFMHFYTDILPIRPFDWKGSQGWKTLDQQTKEKIILL